MTDRHVTAWPQASQCCGIMGDGSATNSTRKRSLPVLASWENLEGNSSPTTGKQTQRVGQARLGGCGVWLSGRVRLDGMCNGWGNWVSCEAWL